MDAMNSTHSLSPCRRSSARSCCSSSAGSSPGSSADSSPVCFERSASISSPRKRASPPFCSARRLKLDAPGLVGGIITWYVRLIFVVMAANAVGITAVSDVLGQIIAFIPNLLVALLILGAFAWLAGITRNLVLGATESAAVPNSGALATLAYATVLGFGIVAAASQIGVAATLINILFTGIVAALALAFGLAFGLGGREEAAQVLTNWRGQATSAIDRVSATPARGTGDGTPESVLAERMRREEFTRRS